MLMRKPGLAAETPCSHAPTYAQEITPGHIDTAVASQLYPVTPADLNALPFEATHNGFLQRQRYEMRTKAKNVLGKLALVPLVIGGLFFVDQQEVAPIVWGDSTASIEQIAANNYSDDGEGTLAVTTTGMSAKRDSAMRIGKALTESLSNNLPNSKLVGIELGSRLHMPDIYAAFDKTVAENNPGRLIFFLPSAATKYGLDLVAYSAEHYPDKQYIIIADSGPVDAHSAYELRYNPAYVGLSQTMIDLQTSGGPLTNGTIDLLGEETQKKYRDYGCVQSFLANDSPAWFACPLVSFRVKQEFERIGRDVFSREGTPSTLRADLVLKIADDSAYANLETIAENAEEPVVFVYLAPLYDSVVDVRYAGDKFRDYTSELGIEYKNFPLTTGHAGADDFRPEYNNAVSEAIKQIDAARELAKNKALANTKHDSFSSGY